LTFTVLEATANEAPLVVEIPHAGLLIDPTAMASLTAPVRAIGQDADLYVDELYERAPSLGASVLVAHASRYVCDLNRSESDVDAGAVDAAAGMSHPHGLIWRLTTEGRPAIPGPLSTLEYQRRLNVYHRPYHTALTRLLERKRERFGYVVLLAAHSMPSAGRAGHLDTGAARAQVVPGSRGRTSAHESVIVCPERLARERNWSVAHDQPYRGGFTTGHYGQPATGIHVIQVELNRSLYMNEQTLERLDPGFSATRDYCESLVEALAKLPENLLLPAS
jgi:N-formylglutamate deformylase